jgi:hypothetical protein
MEDVMQINVNDAKAYTVNGHVDIAASFRRDGESSDRKTVTLRFRLDDVSLSDVLADALRTKRISWQNNVGRKDFDRIADRSVVEVDYTAPGKREKTPEELAKELASKAGVDLSELVKALETMKAKK